MCIRVVLIAIVMGMGIVVAGGGGDQVALPWMSSWWW